MLDEYKQGVKHFRTFDHHISNILDTIKIHFPIFFYRSFLFFSLFSFLCRIM